MVVTLDIRQLGIFFAEEWTKQSSGREMRTSITGRASTKLMSNWMDGHKDAIGMIGMFEIIYRNIGDRQARYRDFEAKEFNLKKKEQSNENPFIS